MAVSKQKSGAFSMHGTERSSTRTGLRACTACVTAFRSLTSVHKGMAVLQRSGQQPHRDTPSRPAHLDAPGLAMLGPRKSLQPRLPGKESSPFHFPYGDEASKVNCMAQGRQTEVTVLASSVCSNTRSDANGETAQTSCGILLGRRVTWRIGFACSLPSPADAAGMYCSASEIIIPVSAICAQIGRVIESSQRPQQGFERLDICIPGCRHRSSCIAGCAAPLAKQRLFQSD